MVVDAGEFVSAGRLPLPICFGPVRAPNTEALGRQLTALGMTQPEVYRIFRTFNPTFPVPLPDPTFPAAPATAAAPGGGLR